MKTLLHSRSDYGFEHIPFTLFTSLLERDVSASMWLPHIYTLKPICYPRYQNHDSAPLKLLSTANPIEHGFQTPDFALGNSPAHLLADFSATAVTCDR